MTTKLKPLLPVPAAFREKCLAGYKHWDAPCEVPGNRFMQIFALQCAWLEYRERKAADLDAWEEFDAEAMLDEILAQSSGHLLRLVVSNP